MEKLYNIHSIRFSKEEMIIIIDHQQYNINLRQVSSRLLNASDEERNNYEFSPLNYGIHWPLIDEDLAINTLISRFKQAPH
jgi:hypothetical protein